MSGDPEKFNFEILLMEIMYINLNMVTNILRIMGVFDAVDYTE
jgi:hypothetical protein